MSESKFPVASDVDQQGRTILELTVKSNSDLSKARAMVVYLPSRSSAAPPT